MSGAFYYLPAPQEFGSDPPGYIPMTDLLFDHWDVKPDNNKYMFYNHKEYLHRMGNARKAVITSSENNENDPYDDPPTQRVLHLVKAMFENWEDTWFHKRRADPIPHLFDTSNDPNIKSYPRIVRQAMAVSLTLGSIYTTDKFEDEGDYKFAESYGVVNDLFRINPHDILAGKMPLYGLGIGQIAMDYLMKDTDTDLSKEHVDAYFSKLNEVSGFGHVVPNYHRMLKTGVPGLLAELARKEANESDPTKKEYYQTCGTVFEGVQQYINNYSLLANFLANRGQSSDIDYALPAEDVQNLNEISSRMSFLANGDPSGDQNGVPRNFVEAVQLLFSLHACLHLASEPVSIGRIDVMLESYFAKESKTDRYRNCLLYTSPSPRDS